LFLCWPLTIIITVVYGTKNLVSETGGMNSKEMHWLQLLTYALKAELPCLSLDYLFFSKTLEKLIFGSIICKVRLIILFSSSGFCKHSMSWYMIGSYKLYLPHNNQICTFELWNFTFI
jgi:hypothetical protein